jgi:hypothetical protein
MLTNHWTFDELPAEGGAPWGDMASRPDVMIP